MSLSGSLMLLAVLTLATRLVPRIIRPYAVSSDAFYHMLAAQRIRENRFRLPERLRGLCFPGPYDYPPLFHYLLAIWPERFLAGVEKLISPVIDVAYVWLVYLAILYFPSLTASGAAPNPAHALTIAALFAVSPGLLYSGKGPRAYNANPRIFSEFLFGALTIASLWWYTSRDPWALAAAAILVAVLVLSSKFGAQVVAFLFPLMALILLEPALLLIPLAGFAVSLLAWRGHYLRIVKANIGHLALFGALGDRRGSPMARKSEWREFFAALGGIGQARSWYRLLCLNSISSFLVRNPQLLLLALVASSLPSNRSTLYLASIIFASLCTFVAITFRPLLFLGEAERYVSYSLPAQFILLSLAWNDVPTWVSAAFAVYSIVLSFAYQVLFVHFNYKDLTRRSQGDELRQFFRSQPAIRRVMPIGEGPYNLAYVTDQEVFYPCGNFQIWETPVSEYLRIYEDFLFPRRDTLVETLEKYKLDSLVINKRNDVRHFRPDPRLFETIFENDTFEVVDLRPKAARSQGPVGDALIAQGATA